VSVEMSFLIKSALADWAYILATFRVVYLQLMATQSTYRLVYLPAVCAKMGTVVMLASDMLVQVTFYVGGI
jgi:hypothetical protein